MAVLPPVSSGDFKPVGALEQLGSAPKESVFIGDSPHDMQAGHAAGVRTAAALWGPFARDALVASAPNDWLASITEVLALDFVGGPR